MTKPPAHYALLGCAPAADVRVIHAAYLALARKHAPRKLGDDEKAFCEIGLAWGVLKNKEFRARYDAELKLLGLNCAGCAGTGLVWRSVGFTQREESRCGKCKGTGRNDL